MAYTPAQVVTSGFPLDDDTFTYLLSGSPVVGQDEGKPVTINTAANATFKIAGAGDPIHGRIFSIEVDPVLGITKGAIQRRFKESFSAAVGHGMVPGDSVVGAANGTVAKAGAANRTMVVESGTNYVVVELL